MNDSNTGTGTVERQPAIFRRAELRDREILLALCASFRESEGQLPAPENVGASIQAALDDDPLIHLFVIEVATSRDREPPRVQMAGYVAVTLGFSIEVGGRDAFLDELYLEPWARGQGIGQQAVAFAERVCREMNVKRLCLEVEHVNERARNLYQSIGYRSHPRSLMSKMI